jgi:NitT/TauT family transport system substrate-binding protein
VLVKKNRLGLTPRRQSAAFVSVLSLALVTACSSSDSGSSDSSSSEATTEITVGLATTPITVTEVVAEIAVPSQLGFFKEENVSVKVQPMAGSTAVIQAAAAGSVDVGEAAAVSVIQAADKGVPVKTFLGLAVSFPYKIVALPDSGITSVADLEGKTLGVTSFASASNDVAKAQLKAADLTGKVKVVQIGAGAAAVAALESNKADALVDYTGDLLAISQSGVKLDDVTMPLDLSRGYFGVTWAAPTSVLKEKKAALTGLSRGMIKGLIWSSAHPEEAVKLGYKEYPQLKPPAATYDKQFALDVASLKQTLTLIAPPLVDGVPGTSQGDDPAKWSNEGCLADSAWTKMIGFAKDAGSITGDGPSVSNVWDDSICGPAAEKIDHQKVIDTPTVK